MLFCPSFTQSERFIHTDQLITRLRRVEPATCCCHDVLHSHVVGKRDRERVQVRCSDLVGSDLPQGREGGGLGRLSKLSNLANPDVAHFCFFRKNERFPDVEEFRDFFSIKDLQDLTARPRSEKLKTFKA